MRAYSILILLVAFLISGFSYTQEESTMEDIQFVCLKTHKASNTCHFNFKVDGANYRYVDNGCKYSKKTDEVIKKVHEGKFFLAKDWKISCPEPRN